jgi:hypothetical protein
MNTLRFIAVSIEIVIKGCMESPVIKTTLILLASVAAIIFIPHWVGLLVAGIFPPGPAWAAGILTLVVIIFIGLVIATAYLLIYGHVKSSMGAKGRRQ